MATIEKKREKLKNGECEFAIPHYDYGECKICDSHLEEKKINQDFWIRGELIVVQDVPAGVCPRCGEKVVKADVGHWLAELLENSDRIARAPRISIPSITFDVEELL